MIGLGAGRDPNGDILEVIDEGDYVRILGSDEWIRMERRDMERLRDWCDRWLNGGARSVGGDRRLEEK